MEENLRVLFDEQYLLNQLSGNIQLYYQILNKFNCDLLAQIHIFEVALKENDFKSIEFHGHKLKGISSSVGCHKMSQIASEIHQAGQQKNSEKSLLLFSLLKNNIKSTQGILDKVLSNINGQI